MKSKTLMAATAALATLVAASAFADNIYRWTDANGNVHYGDRPTGASTEERIQLTYQRTDPAKVAERVQAYRDAADASDRAREEADAADALAAEEAAVAEENRKKCESTRAQLQTMLDARRVYRVGEDGEREYLDNDQRASVRQQAEEYLRQYCN